MNKRGRPSKYVTIEKFEKFVSNDFRHVQIKLNYVVWVSTIILATIIAKFVMG